ncbi:MarR family winged helix-turn-helix transcriptional regulator [Hydrogenophaga sp.]|uniref:MarR family winged helix-turn-helix transcriptional regulator n=1 Tax=Hydrogenophaga sp. TaxID=1904254 RepID=UPI003D1316DE
MPTPQRAKALQLERSLLYHCAGITNRVGGSVHALCRERYGMSPAAWRVMAHVGELQPITAKEIGLRAAMDSVNLSRALGQLDGLGFVQRHIDTTDRRRIILQLSPAGQAVYDTVAPLTVKAEQTLLAELNAQERATLRELIRRVWERSRELFDSDESETTY